MKRFVLLIMFGLLWGCSASVVEVVDDKVVEPPKVVIPESEVEEPLKIEQVEDGPEVVEDVTEEPVDEEIEESIPNYVTTDSYKLLPPESCRIQNVRQNQQAAIGFPIPTNRIPSVGDINVQVIFVDFPDFEGTRTQQQRQDFVDNYASRIQRFYDAQSFGRVQFSFNVYPEFIRIPERARDLKLTWQFGPSGLQFVMKESVRLSNSNINYADIDILMVILNPDIPFEFANASIASLSLNGGIPSREKVIHNAMILGGDTFLNGYSIAAHEIGHLFGLYDLYNFTEDESELTKFLGVFDFMNYAPPHYQYGDNRDMMGWQRLLLDWITLDQVRCVDSSVPSKTTHQLLPVHLDEEGEKLVIVRLSIYKAMVIEVKDRNRYCEVCNGGIYISIADSYQGNGAGPLRLLRPDHSQDKWLRDAYLSIGQSLRYENITVEIIDHFSTPIIQINVD